ncbi:MAG: glycosyltransferase [Rudaea sp.]|nr:glycosyltransferase [Rudaea sp.]
MTVDSSNQPKRRLLVVTSMFPRWADDSEPGFVFELSRRLTAGFDVRVLAPHARGAAATEVMDGVEVVRYRYAPESFETLAYGGGIVPKLRKQPWKWLLVPFFLFGQYLAIRRELKCWRPDAIHAHWIIPQGVIAAIVCGSRKRPVLITTAHGTDVFALNGRLLRRVKRFVLDRSDAVTVVSNALREVVSCFVTDVGKIRVEPMGVDLKHRFTLDAESKRSHHEILFVGRLAEIKGLRYLLDAVATRLLKRYPDVSIVIVGFGPEEAALRAQAKELGIEDRVTFLGPVAQSALPALYRRASVFVAPFVRGRYGDQEGLGLVLVEAIGCACPVVASALPGVRDVVGAYTQCLVEPGNSSVLADAIAGVLDDPNAAARLNNELRDHVLVKFDWTAVAQRYQQLLGSAIQGRTIA